MIYGSRPLIDVAPAGHRDRQPHQWRLLATIPCKGFAGNDTLIGWEDDDLLAGGARATTRSGGGDGDDTLRGNGDDDSLAGGADDDILGGVVGRG